MFRSRGSLRYGNDDPAGVSFTPTSAAIFTTRKDKLPYQHNIVMSQLYPTSQMLAECITFEIGRAHV